MPHPNSLPALTDFAYRHPHAPKDGTKDTRHNQEGPDPTQSFSPNVKMLHRTRDVVRPNFASSAIMGASILAFAGVITNQAIITIAALITSCTTNQFQNESKFPLSILHSFIPPSFPLCKNSSSSRQSKEASTWKLDSNF